MLSKQLNLNVQRDQEFKPIILKIIKIDPYFGFPIRKDTDLEIYEKLHNKKFKCLSQYMGSEVPMIVQCPNGHINKGLPKKLTIPCNNCKECWKERELTPAAKMIEIIQSKGGQLLTDYAGSRAKVTIKCSCDNIFNITPDDIISGRRCNVCAGNDVNEAKKNFYSMLKSLEAVALTPYINSITKVDIKCKNGHIYDQVPSSTNMGYKCRFSMGNNAEDGETHFIQLVTEKKGVILSGYENRNVLVYIRCEQGHIFRTCLRDVAAGRWCTRCNNKCPIQAKERFIARVLAHGGEVIGEYKICHEKVLIKCKLGHVSCGEWCRICNLSESHGKRSIREYLTLMNIPHQREITFDWLPRKRYDFYFHYNGRNYLVEFDGIQHFKYSPFFHKDEEAFQARKTIDIVKTKSALDNGYFLIRIADSDIDDISVIIDKVINNPILESRLLLSDPLKYQWIFDDLQI